MTSEVVIDVQEKEISIALLEDKSLVEYQTEPRSASFSVGNIYVAKVKKLMAGLNASFVNVGYERDAFLHYLDLGSQFNSYGKYLKQVESDRKKLYPFSKASRLPDLKKDGSIATTLQKDQEVLVQIVKEPISTKGPRMTAELSFAGRPEPGIAFAILGELARVAPDEVLQADADAVRFSALREARQQCEVAGVIRQRVHHAGGDLRLFQHFGEAPEALDELGVGAFQPEFRRVALRQGQRKRQQRRTGDDARIEARGGKALAELGALEAGGFQ